MSSRTNPQGAAPRLDPYAEARAHVEALWAGQEGVAYLFLGYGGHLGSTGTYEFRRPEQHFIPWPEQSERLLTTALDHAAEADVYIAPLLRREESGAKGSALSGRVVWADVDGPLEGDRAGLLRHLHEEGALIVASGHGEHVYLLLAEELPPGRIESLNRRLMAYLGADSGWAENKVLRLAGTANHKPRAAAPPEPSIPVRLMPTLGEPRRWAVVDLEAVLPPDPHEGLQEGDATPIEPEPVPDDLPEHIARRLGEEPGTDRSGQTHGLIAAALEWGYSDGQVLGLALDHRPTVAKFGERRGGVAAQVADVLAKLRPLHQHVGQPCDRASCSSRPAWMTGEPEAEPEAVRSHPQPPAPDHDSPTPPAWPEPPGEEAFHGIAGDFVRLVEPRTESDPVALLTQFLVGFGSVVGRGPHFRAESDEHHANLFSVLVGATGSEGRKGSSLGYVRALLGSAEQAWLGRWRDGLSSGEGVIHAVRDHNGDDPGEPDKRLAVVEVEFVSALRQAQRDGNVLSAVLRKAWDGQVIGTLTRTKPLTATGAHVSITGHITSEELKRELTKIDAANGFGNRFAWFAVRRARMLPSGGRIDAADIQPLVRRLPGLVRNARMRGELRRDAQAEALWHRVYEPLTTRPPYLLGALLGRAEAQVMRLALVYALLDDADRIRIEHLVAALALWDYSARSAAFIFGDMLGDDVADTILDELRRSPTGLTRTEIYRDVFGSNRPAGRIKQALEMLRRAGMVRMEREPTAGRPTERWHAGIEPGTHVRRVLRVGEPAFLTFVRGSAAGIQAEVDPSAPEEVGGLSFAEAVRQAVLCIHGAPFESCPFCLIESPGTAS